jgi:hypothetical protein
MALDEIATVRLVGGKRVYIVDDHHKILAAWAMERRKLTEAPYLLTIDHHTDTCPAFAGCASLAFQMQETEDEEGFARALLSAVNWSNDASISDAISMLKHDEHIVAATASAVLAAAFVIQLSDQSGYSSIEEGVHVLSHQCAIGCNKRPYDDECKVHHALQIIESVYLDDQLGRLASITESLGLPSFESLPYILDIDLDVFHSLKAASPDDNSTFRRLIRGAVAVTIATEAECLRELWQDEGNEPSVEALQCAVFRHIEAAQAL